MSKDKKKEVLKEYIVGFRDDHDCDRTSVVAKSPSQARYMYWRENLQDGYPDYQDVMKWLRCRVIGLATVSAYFEYGHMFDHVIEMRNIPFCYIGQTVEVCGRRATVCGVGGGANLKICYDVAEGCTYNHPYWETVYFDKSGNVVADYRETKAS